MAAVYYIMVLRESTKNRRVTLTTTLMQSFMSDEGTRTWLELLRIQWENFDDFVNKFDSTVNMDNFVKRTRFWNSCEVLGLQYKSKLIDFDTLYSICGTMVPQMWTKYKPIIEEYRKRGVYNRYSYANFEYLAEEMTRVMEKRDPNFDQSSSYLRAPTR